MSKGVHGSSAFNNLRLRTQLGGIHWQKFRRRRLLAEDRVVRQDGNLS